jgi:hypothetical protein
MNQPLLLSGCYRSELCEPVWSNFRLNGFQPKISSAVRHGENYLVQFFLHYFASAGFVAGEMRAAYAGWLSLPL